MSETQNLRDELFPDGMPEPDEFIQTVVKKFCKKWLNNFFHLAEQLVKNVSKPPTAHLYKGD